MRTHEIELTTHSDRRLVELEVAVVLGGLRDKTSWLRLESLNRAEIVLKGPIGFEESFTVLGQQVLMDEYVVRSWDEALEEMLMRFDMAWRTWEDHRAKLRALDALGKPSLRDLALDEIAERHLQGRPPYHVTMTLKTDKGDEQVAVSPRPARRSCDLDCKLYKAARDLVEAVGDLPKDSKGVLAVPEDLLPEITRLHRALRSS
jgi:hypothetical protein